jgi:hypothetical protein
VEIFKKLADFPIQLAIKLLSAESVAPAAGLQPVHVFGVLSYFCWLQPVHSLGLPVVPLAGCWHCITGRYRRRDVLDDYR